MAPAKKTTSNASARTSNTRTDSTPAKKKDEPEALFIPAGLLTGMGFGFLYGNLVAGLFLGLGLGFLVFAFLSVTKRRA